MIPRESTQRRAVLIGERLGVYSVGSRYVMEKMTKKAQSMATITSLLRVSSEKTLLG